MVWHSHISRSLGRVGGTTHLRAQSELPTSSKPPPPPYARVFLRSFLLPQEGLSLVLKQTRTETSSGALVITPGGDWSPLNTKPSLYTCVPAQQIISKSQKENLVSTAQSSSCVSSNNQGLQVCKGNFKPSSSLLREGPEDLRRSSTV